MIANQVSSLPRDSLQMFYMSVEKNPRCRNLYNSCWLKVGFNNLDSLNFWSRGPEFSVHK